LDRFMTPMEKDIVQFRRYQDILDMTYVLKKTQSDKNTYSPELIPHGILEMIENFSIYNSHIGNLKCFCSKPDYYYRNSLICLLIHLNDYHKMTFRQIGDWLEKRGM
jgi:hypothetical protein